MAQIPEEGQLVSVRERRYVVADVARDALGDSPTRSGHHLISLNSIEDDGLGEELQVVWELEPGARVFERSTLRLSSIVCGSVPSTHLISDPTNQQQHSDPSRPEVPAIHACSSHAE